jgi:predicted GNAT family N-acyltransferase
MTIKKYSSEDEFNLITLIKSEGEDWSDYTSELGRSSYIRAIETSIVYVIYESNEIIAFIRCKEDNGFGIYVYDLLVRQDKRGNKLGQLLIEKVKNDYPEQSIYIMSDVDEYYIKCGYKKIGSIFEV